LEDFGVDDLYVHSPCNHFIKNYTEVFYMTYKRRYSVLWMSDETQLVYVDEIDGLHLH